MKLAYFQKMVTKVFLNKEMYRKKKCFFKIIMGINNLILILDLVMFIEILL